MCKYKNKINKSGAVLITAIIGLVVLGAFGVTLTFTVVSANKSTVNLVQSQKAFSSAEAGIQKAIYYLTLYSTYTTAGKTETIEDQRYTIVVTSKPGSTFDITSTGTYRQSTKTAYQTVNVTTSTANHPGFSYALFTGNGNGLLYNTSWIQGNVLARGDVYVTQLAKITDGTAAATGNVYGQGTYTKGTLPNPVPTMPSLNTSYYDTLISSANGQPAGNRIITTTINLSSSTIYVRGNVTIRDNAIVNGPGRIVATGNITVQNNARVRNKVELISGIDVTVTNSGRIEDYGLIFTRRYVYIRISANITGDIVAQNRVYLYNNSQIRGIIFTQQYIYFYTTANVRGSVVAQQAQLSNSARLTYDTNYIGITPTGIQRATVNTVSTIPYTWYGG